MTEYEGDLEAYRRSMRESRPADAEKRRAIVRASQPVGPKSLLEPKRRAARDAETRLQECMAEKSAIERQLASADLPADERLT